MLQITIMRSIDSTHPRRIRCLIPSPFFAVSVVCFGAIQIDFALAENIDFSVSLTEFYSDNIFLLSKELQEADFVTIIRPQLGFNHEGNQSEVNIDYVYEALFYKDDSDFNEDYHKLDSDAFVNLIGNELKLAGQAVYTQYDVDPTKQLANSNIPITGNRSNAFSWRIGPDWIRKIPFDSQIDVKYRYGQVDYDAEKSQDVNSQRLIMGLSSDPDVASSMTYELEYNYWILDYETSGEVREQRVAFTLRQEINETTNVFGRVGSESDIRDPQDGSLSQSAWEVGSNYANGDFSVLAAVGERYFGTTYRLNISQLLANFRLSASYSEQPGTTESFYLAEIPVDSEDDLVLEPPPPGLDEPGSAATFIRKRADGGIGWRGHRLGANLVVWWDERRDLVAPDDNPETRTTTNSIGSSLAFTWQVGTRTTTRLWTTWANRETTSVARDDTTWSVGATVGYDLGRYTTLGSGVGYSRSTANDYEEFHASVSISRKF